MSQRHIQDVWHGGAALAEHVRAYSFVAISVAGEVMIYLVYLVVARFNEQAPGARYNAQRQAAKHGGRHGVCPTNKARRARLPPGRIESGGNPLRVHNVAKNRRPASIDSADNNNGQRAAWRDQNLGRLGLSAPGRFGATRWPAAVWAAPAAATGQRGITGLWL